MTGADLTPVPLLLATLGAAVLLGASRWLPRRGVDAIAIATAAGSLVICAIVMVASAHAPIVYWVGGWNAREGLALGIVLHVEPLGAGLAVLACMLTTGALVYSSRYFRAFEGRCHALMLLFLAALIGFSYSLDLFNLFVWFEVMSVAAYALTGFHHEESPAIEGGINFAITNSIGSFATLFGIGLVYARTGLLDLTQIGSVVSGSGPDAWLAVALVLVCVGLLTKAAIIPFHFWLTDAHAVAPTPVCVLFSGIMVELALYGIARIYWSAFAGAALGHAFSSLLVGVGATTIFFASILCFLQKHLKRLLAYSTIAHAGVILVGIGLLEPRALAGGIAYIAAHGLTKGALFLCVGLLLHRFGSVNEIELHAVGRDMRGTFVLLVIAVASLAGAPPFGTFHARALIDEALRASHAGWIVHVLTFGTILTSAAILRAGLRIFLGWGPPPRAGEQGDRADIVETETYGPRGRLPRRLWVPALVFVAIAGGMGAAPSSWRQGLLGYAARFCDPASYQRDVLHGPDLASIRVPVLHAPHHATWIVTAVGTIGLALLALRFGHRIRSVPGLRLLRRLHAGDVGEYASWMLAGMAVFVGIVAALAD